MSIEEYIDQLPKDRKISITYLRKVILKKLPKGFKETISYGMIGYVVPHSIYPKGYDVDPSLPLPFMSIASQKNFIAIYHMGIYSDKELFEWFTSEYNKLYTTKLDMGKNCIRFKNMSKIPYELIGTLASKIQVAEWIQTYEENVSKR